MAGKRSVRGFRAAATAVAFNSMGTSPSLSSIQGGSGGGSVVGLDPEIADLSGKGDVVLKLTFVSGSGSPAIAANNVVITLPAGVNPTKVFISDGATAPKFHVASISSNVVTLGTKVAPAASTTYTVELICVS